MKAVDDQTVLACCGLHASPCREPRRRRHRRLRATPPPEPQKIEMCIGCHGIAGWRTAFPEVYKVPKIGGQHEAYIVRALQAYRDRGAQPSVDEGNRRDRCRTRTSPTSPRTTRGAAEDGEQMTTKTMIRNSARVFRDGGVQCGSAALAADLKAGEAKVKEVCQACHGARRQQPEGRLSEARRPVSGLSGQGAARLQVGCAQESDHGVHSRERSRPRT